MEKTDKEIMNAQKQIETVKNNIAIGLKLFEDMAIRKNIEVWKPIDGYDKYAVSSKARVRNNKTNRILKLHKNMDGYHYVSLWKDGKGKNFPLRRLVALAFIDNPDNKNSVDHINNKRTDNNINNLRWCTLKENQHNRQIGKNNTSGTKGVYFNKAAKKWLAYIKLNSKMIYIGLYETLEDATEARQIKAKELFGTFINSCEKI